MKTGIALFVYNRPDHTKQVLEGLRKNHIDKLYVFADGPKKEEHVPAVKEVRQIISEIDWCETEVIQSEINKGLANSIVFGVNYVLNKHERIIVLEDDCVPSGDFLNFMEQCFDKYADEPKVMSISGYSLPIEIPADYSSDIYFTYRSSSWGWGTWKRAWKFFSRNNDIYKEINEDEDLMEKVKLSGEDLLTMLERQIKGEIDSWSIYWTLNIIKNGGICLEPVKSRLKNIGMDGSGVHCGSTKAFDAEILNENKGKKLSFPSTLDVNQQIAIKHGGFFCSYLPENSLIRFKTYYELLDKWLYNIHHHLRIADFLKARGMKNIAIFGTGEIGARLYEELKDTDITVSFFLRTNSVGSSTYFTKNVISLMQLKQYTGWDLDCIIVTPVFDYVTIKKDIQTIVPNIKICSIESIVNLIYFEGINEKSWNRTSSFLAHPNLERLH